MGWRLDTSAKSQVNTPVENRRSIYDASKSEIFWKSLIAGFALGLGQTLATVLFFGVIAGLLITSLRPFLEQIGVPIDDLEVVLQQRVDQAEETITPSPVTSPTTTTTVGE